MNARIPFLARALRHFDGPLTADLRDLAEGPSHTFFVEEKSGWRGIDIDRVLESKGIKVWGKMIVAGDIMLTVRRDQARWAQYTLERAGVPIKPGFAFCASSCVMSGGGAGGSRFVDRLMAEVERGADWLTERFGGDLLRED